MRDFCVLAEKAGFEPALRLSRTTPLAGEPLQPLGYFSIAVVKKHYCSANHRSFFQSLIYDIIIKRLCQRDLSIFSLFFYIFRLQSLCVMLLLASDSQFYSFFVKKPKIVIRTGEHRDVRAKFSIRLK